MVWNRTGIATADAYKIVDCITSLKYVRLAGLHAYDGYIRDADFVMRKQHTEIPGFNGVSELFNYAKNKTGKALTIVAGGTPTFPVHAMRSDVECSPGTFVFFQRLGV